MSDLSEFLAARLAEDEGYVRELLSPSASYANFHAKWELPSSAIVDTGDGDIDTNHKLLAWHIARWDPARVLAEVEAKRAILAMYMLDEHSVAYYTPYAEAAEDAAKALAQVYADHPDFDPAWTLTEA